MTSAVWLDRNEASSSYGYFEVMKLSGFFGRRLPDHAGLASKDVAATLKWWLSFHLRKAKNCTVRTAGPGGCTRHLAEGVASLGEACVTSQRAGLLDSLLCSSQFPKSKASQEVHVIKINYSETVTVCIKQHWSRALHLMVRSPNFQDNSWIHQHLWTHVPVDHTTNMTSSKARLTIGAFWHDTAAAMRFMSIEKGIIVWIK